MKAKIIGAIPETQREGYNRKWEDAEEELGRSDFNTLFGHIRTVVRKAKAKETVLKEFEEHIHLIKTPTKFIDELLLPMAQAYGELSASAYSAPSHSDSVNEYLRWLNRLEFNDWVPPALAYAVRNREQPALMEAFFRGIERLAYCMLVTGQGVNDRIERFAKVTSEIESAADIFRPDSPLQLTPPEQLAFFEKLDGPIYDSLSAKARLPVLLRLDSLLSDGSARYEYPVISVEHVLPQRPKAESKWLEWFPDALVRASTIHRLGNLALLNRRKNSQASNWDFERKKKAYFRNGSVCPFAVTTQVLDKSVWNMEVVEARQRDLMQILDKHWKLGERKSMSDWLMDSI
ncbi:hypothetical protein CKY39_07895 [Variovorax boronicumulans]|uniref:GmrSD restriction endonucleases C-terminal domain-containing protein n=1 Tax=Variovorax boronicumulans TaxID=436515 RepID=A0A250DFM7_9BURK|nr:HNH endonuclease family protein [Variovorax boronicumulans]ATA53140.1 hypothetical protein CKY39_07895 [Variovorax boronicumulans]